MGVLMFNVHASGGRAMMRAAADGGARRPRLRVPRPLVSGSPCSRASTAAPSRPSSAWRISRGARAAPRRLAREAGLDGCVASPQEIGALRGALGASG